MILIILRIFVAVFGIALIIAPLSVLYDCKEGEGCAVLGCLSPICIGGAYGLYRLWFKLPEFVELLWQRLASTFSVTVIWVVLCISVVFVAFCLVALLTGDTTSEDSDGCAGRGCVSLIGCGYGVYRLWPYLPGAAEWLWHWIFCDNGAFLIAFVIIIFGCLLLAMSGEKGCSEYGCIFSVIGCGYGIYRYFPGTAKWLWSCLGWIFNVVSGGVSWIFNGVLGGVSWISNSLNFGAIYGSLGAGSEYYTCIFIAAIVAFILCYNNDNKQNKWAGRCWCYIPVILLAAAPLVGNYANVPIFGITPVGVSTLGADVVASQVILLIWLLVTALVLVVGMYIEKQRNELQAKIKAVNGALEKLRAEL